MFLTTGHTHTSDLLRSRPPASAPRLRSVVLVVLVMGKSWMKLAETTNGKLCSDYTTGVIAFVESVKGVAEREGKIRCPCKKCMNAYWHSYTSFKETRFNAKEMGASWAIFQIFSKRLASMRRLRSGRPRIARAYTLR